MVEVNAPLTYCTEFNPATGLLVEESRPTLSGGMLLPDGALSAVSRVCASWRFGALFCGALLLLAPEFSDEGISELIARFTGMVRFGNVGCGRTSAVTNTVWSPSG